MATAPRGSFSNANRHMQEEEKLQLTSVGVDIGSSTSHLVFSRLELTLEGSRYRVTKREVLERIADPADALCRRYENRRGSAGNFYQRTVQDRQDPP